MRYANPSTWNEYPNLPWIHFQAAHGGGFYVRNLNNGQVFFASNMAGVHEFAADNSTGLGTAIHKVTSAMGVQRCAPCARRQAKLNGIFRLFK
jgi:hypothetical protein